MLEGSREKVLPTEDVSYSAERLDVLQGCVCDKKRNTVDIYFTFHLFLHNSLAVTAVAKHTSEG